MAAMRSGMLRLFNMVIVCCSLCGVTDSTSVKLDTMLTSLNMTITFGTNHISHDDSNRLHYYITQGQLKVLLKELKVGHILDYSQLSQVHEILNQVQYINSFNNVTDIDGVVTGAMRWELDFPLRSVDANLTFKHENGEVISQKINQYCLEQLYGLNKFAGRPCSISQYCWKYMTSDKTSINFISKQINYLLTAYNHGCQNEMATMADLVGQLSVQFISERMCATLLPQVIAFHGAKQWDDRPIEYMVSCGILGFKDFIIFYLSNLDYLLSLQMDDGCISNSPQRKISGSILTSLLQLVGLGQLLQQQSPCFPERTSKVAALLSLFLRYFIDNPNDFGYNIVNHA
ncbi:hypothetical protein CHUAL_004134 [Chamberlinius hualienensis]